MQDMKLQDMKMTDQLATGSVQTHVRICRHGGSRCISVPNFVKIGETVFDISRFFLFFMMADAAIFDFRNSQILLAEGVWTAKLHHRTKFR